MAFRFVDLTPCGKLRALWKGQQTILDKLEQIMSRGDEIKADIEVLRAEQQETADKANAAIARVQDAVTALTAQVATLTAGQVSDADLAAINAATADIKAAADDAQAAFDEVQQPPVA